MDADGGNPQRLTNDLHSDWHPSWSPDGERIVFTSDRDRDFEIYVMDADGGNPQKLTNNVHDDTDPAWFDPTFAVAPARKKNHDVGVAQTGYPITAIIEKTVLSEMRKVRGWVINAKGGPRLHAIINWSRPFKSISINPKG